MPTQPPSTPMPEPVNALGFEEQVLKPTLPVLVEVSSNWCPPCRAAEPELQRIAAEHGSQLRVLTLDADEAPELIARLGVRGVPTFLLFRGGREVSRLAGFPGARRLRSWLDGATSSS